MLLLEILFDEFLLIAGLWLAWGFLVNYILGARGHKRRR